MKCSSGKFYNKNYVKLLALEFMYSFSYHCCFTVTFCMYFIKQLISFPVNFRKDYTSMFFLIIESTVE